MSHFKLIEVKSSNGKDYFIEGYVSTVDPDFVNDIVDNEGQKATNREISNGDITMDEDHNEWRNPDTGKLYDGKKNKYPIAKVEQQKLDSRGTWVRAKLNKFHPEFTERILPMIKDGFLHSFSIAYKVKKSINKVIDNVKYRIIQDLAIANIAITGNPVNKHATFNMALKSFPKMVEEKNIQELETLNTELKSKVESLESELTELKAMDYKMMYEELKMKYDKMYSKMDDSKEKKDTEMKSFNTKLETLETTVKKLEKENAELKSFVESPQLKSIVEAKSVEPKKNEVTKVTMFDMC
jgi:hypothetical protein